MHDTSLIDVLKTSCLLLLSFVSSHQFFSSYLSISLFSSILGDRYILCFHRVGSARNFRNIVIRYFDHSLIDLSIIDHSVLGHSVLNDLVLHCSIIFHLVFDHSIFEYFVFD